MQTTERITVIAPVDVVWRTLTDISQWPRWQGEVSRTAVPDRLAHDQTFTWTSGGMPIRSTIVRCDPPYYIEWTGETYGTKACHTWRLIEAPEGTLVETSESMKGWLVSLIGFFKRDFLSTSLRQTLAELKEEAEHVHAA